MYLWYHWIALKKLNIKYFLKNFIFAIARLEAYRRDKRYMKKLFRQFSDIRYTLSEYEEKNIT